MKPERVLGLALKIGALLVVDVAAAVLGGVVDAVRDVRVARRRGKSKRHP